MIQIISDLIEFYSNHRANVTIYEESIFMDFYIWYLFMHNFKSLKNLDFLKVMKANFKYMLLVKLFMERNQWMQCEWHCSIYDDGDENVRKCINIHFIRLQCLRCDPISMTIVRFYV